MFIIQSSSAELQTTGVCVHSFARDYWCQQFWSFCFFPHPPQKGEQQRYQNLALGLKCLFESCQYLFMNWKYKEISLVLFLQTFQARVFRGWLFWSETDTIRKFCTVLYIRRVIRDWRFILQVTVTQNKWEHFFFRITWMYWPCKIATTYKQVQWLKITSMHVLFILFCPGCLNDRHTQLSISQVPCGNLYICTLTEKCIWGLTILKEGNKNFKLNSISS